MPEVRNSDQKSSRAASAGFELSCVWSVVDGRNGLRRRSAHTSEEGLELIDSNATAYVGTSAVFSGLTLPSAARLRKYVIAIQVPKGMCGCRDGVSCRPRVLSIQRHHRPLIPVNPADSKDDKICPLSLVHRCRRSSCADYEHRQREHTELPVEQRSLSSPAHL
jgi:hypothetical protein